MRAGDVVRLALLSLDAARSRTLVLVCALAVLVFLPAVLGVATGRLERSLLARAERSPILIGPAGSRFDTTLAALYFRGRTDRKVEKRALALVEERGYGVAVPLHTEHSVQGIPLVGTTLEYLEVRSLAVAEGRRFALIGEVVVGAAAAARYGIEPGDRLRSDRRDLTDLGAPSAVTLEVVGVLAPAGTPDDDAAFADVKTAWWLDGHYHGHAAVEAPGDATTATFLFTEPAEARASIHLHGEDDRLPLSAILVVPNDARAHDQLLGDLGAGVGAAAGLEGIRPSSVVHDVLQVVGRLEVAARAALVLVALAALALLVLVIVLTLRLRRAELELLAWLGASRSEIAILVATELALTLLAASALAAAGVAGALVVLPRVLPL